MEALTIDFSTACFTDGQFYYLCSPQPVVTVALPTTLSGGALMPGFSLVVPLF
jgi:hypothetical protein